ncbi:MAG: hypothetical protein H0V27_08540 [Pyrinomonadaceae bacterium]|nr:hypothetical protein [Pyrinomonadaceae bacterium]
MLKNRRYIIIIILIASVLFAAGCNNKRAGRRGGGAGAYPAAALPAVRTLPPLPVRPLSPELQELRVRAATAAATTRELAWDSDVGMTELSGWEYGTRSREMAEVLGGNDLRVLSRLGIAGGMLPEGTDLATLAASFTAVSANATYSPLDKQVLLLTDKNRNDSLLTHEFVHALQDQHFDLLNLLLARPYSFDRTEAMFAVVEGDAVGVQRRVDTAGAWERKSLDEIARAEDDRFVEYRQEVGRLFPPLLTETFIFRYRDGTRFVEAVRRARGERGVDDLFRRPPQSAEQILHPEKFLANAPDAQPRDVQLDEASFSADGWRSVASSPLGETGVRGLLMANLSAKEAVRAAAGWGGDRAYLFERANGSSAPLFVWKTVWDKSDEAAEFFNAYNALKRNSEGESRDVSEDKAQVVWRTAKRSTLVRRAGDTVIIIRGADADVLAALENSLR